MREWLKKIRENQCLSQLDIANKVGISYSYYNFIERGIRRPSPQVAKCIAKTLGFTNEWYRLLEKEELPNVIK